MTAVTPKQLAGSALTLLLMAADAMISATRPSSAGRGAPLEQVEAYASSLETGETAMHTNAFDKGREYHLEAATWICSCSRHSIAKSTGTSLQRALPKSPSVPRTPPVTRPRSR